MRVIFYADVNTCASLLTIPLLRSLVTYDLEKRYEQLIYGEEYLMLMYCANNKASYKEKYYYETVCLPDSSSKAHLFLSDLILAKNLFNLSEAKVQIAADSELQLANRCVPVLVGESGAFKVTFALVKKHQDGSRTKVCEFTRKFGECSANRGELYEDGCGIRYRLENRGIEPPRHDYEFEEFTNYSLSLECAVFDKMMLLKKLEESSC